jgi:hypothetical protein
MAVLTAAEEERQRAQQQLQRAETAEAEVARLKETASQRRR